jgi:hypothetical protein
MRILSLNVSTKSTENRQWLLVAEAKGYLNDSASAAEGAFRSRREYIL